MHVKNGSPEVAGPLPIAMRMTSRLRNGPSYHAYALFVNNMIVLRWFYFAILDCI